MTIEGLQKHLEVIKAWKENPTREVQLRQHHDDKWLTRSDPSFNLEWEYRLKHQIEAWAVVKEGEIHATFGAFSVDSKSAAERYAKNQGGTVIRLVPEKEVK